MSLTLISILKPPKINVFKKRILDGFFLEYFCLRLFFTNKRCSRSNSFQISLNFTKICFYLLELNTFFTTLLTVFSKQLLKKVCIHFKMWTAILCASTLSCRSKSFCATSSFTVFLKQLLEIIHNCPKT